MAEESLKIVLTADNKQAIAAMKETVTSLNQVDNAAGKTGGKVVSMGKDFTGLSRVIQDLPYGFNAIANNLTNILPAAGALGLGISALVAGLQFASLGFDNWTRGLGESKKATEDAAKANEEYLSSIAKEKTQLDLLFRTASNVNVPMAARVQAIKTLRNEMGGYLQDVTDEELLAGKAGKAYEKLAEAIVKSARARAASSLIEKKQLEKLELEQEIANKKAASELEISKIKTPGVRLGQTGSGLGVSTGKVVTVEQRKKEAQDKYNASVAESIKRIDVLDAEMKKLGVTYDENVIKPLKLTQEEEEKLKKIQQEKDASLKKAIKDEKASLSEMLKAREAYFAEIDRMADESLAKRDQRRLKEMKGELDTIKPMAIDPKTGKETSPEIQNKEWSNELQKLKLTTQGNSALNQVMLQRNQIEEQRIANLELANNLTNTAMNSLNGLANAMMNGQNIGQALGDMFKRLAIDIALAAAKAAIFQAILSAVSGGTAGKAGGGGFFKTFGKMLGFSEGGTVSGPRSGYPVMLHGTEHIVRPDQMRSIIASAAQMGGGSNRVVVEGRISGNDIFISQKRTSSFRALTT